MRCGKHVTDWPVAPMCCTEARLWPLSVYTVPHEFWFFLWWSGSALPCTLLIILHTRCSLPRMHCTLLSSWKSCVGQHGTLFPQCCSICFSLPTVLTLLRLFPCLTLTALSFALRKLRQCRARAKCLLANEWRNNDLVDAWMSGCLDDWMSGCLDWHHMVHASPLRTLFSDSSRRFAFSTDRNQSPFCFLSLNESVY